jgi:peptidoglycan/xylan/chitin deacetylase (PgdA/CDA1 family)
VAFDAMTPGPVYITTSWDDGHPLDLRLAELLCKYALPATFYIPLHNERTVLPAAHVRELSEMFEIGAHTVHHSDLRAVPNDLARREIADCKTALEQIIGRPCTSFCFPKGRFRRRHLAQVRDAGYRLARTVELMSLAMPRIQSGIAIMPTSLQAVPAGFSTFARNSLKRLHPANLFRYVRYQKSNWAATAEAVLKRVLNRGGVFHLWGHSWEIEEMGQWQNVERVFALLAQCKGQAIFVDNTKLADAPRM